MTAIINTQHRHDLRFNDLDYPVADRVMTVSKNDKKYNF